MKGFNFEKNLAHQSAAVESTVAVFENLSLIKPTGVNALCINPTIDSKSIKYKRNLHKIQTTNNISEKKYDASNIIDIMMETGTGKTYTYTKTIFELNKQYGIFKFVVVVPTLSIKAGTIDFLNSDSSREHFRELYGKTIKTHVVASIKKKKNKKTHYPAAVSGFVTARAHEKDLIQVLIINTGMINSDTMQKSFDRSLFDKYSVPFDAIKAVNPFLIIDEPHKFAQANKTWENIKKIGAQYIFRYGATFPERDVPGRKDELTGKTLKEKDYKNLVYTLSAVDSFNQNLVKGVIGHITEFESGKNAAVKLLDTDGKEASFELIEGAKRSNVRLTKKESLQRVHSAMTDLNIENLTKSKVVLSNGMELKKGDRLNPYSYAQTLQEIMIRKAVKNHFVLEKDLLQKDVRIKPLTLFFIDNIEEYRNKEGYLRKTVEQYIKAEVEALLKEDTSNDYAEYLQKTLSDISLTHGGYFSKDNSEKDEAIEKEINEILHDKQAILDLENPRRFIFSKWTLREGWDNPNVFQICKLRSSGSEISKLQEVGRGLRLPVNEYGNRVKDSDFYLNYFVDFTESDFVDNLVNEINTKSGAVSIDDNPEKLTGLMIRKILDNHKEFKDENTLLQKLIMEDKYIDFAHNFINAGLKEIKSLYPEIFEGVGTGKIRTAGEQKRTVGIRTAKYRELQELWEKLNEKVILEYKFEKGEDSYRKLLTDFFNKENLFTTEGIEERKAQINITGSRAEVEESATMLDDTLTPVSTMKYSDFLRDAANSLNVNIKTIHSAIAESDFEINKYLNPSTIRIIRQEFNAYLMAQVFTDFEIEYQKVSNAIHPTSFTDEKGNVLKEVPASDIGVLYSDSNVAPNYFLNALYYDSDLEKVNIETYVETNIAKVVVFTKIPKNSIKIPCAGGSSYSPDFAYVIEYNNGEKKLHFIVESKNVEREDQLRTDEKKKIEHAERLFAGKVDIKFKKQFKNNHIKDLIREITQ